MNNPNHYSHTGPGDMEGRAVMRAYVCRESGDDRGLLLGKIQQTLGPDAATDHGVAEVLSWGLDPYLRPQAYGAELRVHGRSRSVTLVHRGSLFLYHTGSAAARNLKDEPVEALNVFCEQLIGLVQDYRPRELVVADFPRLVRASEFSGRLLAAVEKRVKLVRFGAQRLEPGTPEGRLMWHILAMVSEMERQFIVSRLLMGRLARCARGEWPFNETNLPFGYRLEGNMVVPDIDKLDEVRAVIQGMGEPGLTKSEKLGRLNAAGLTSLRLGQSEAKRSGGEVEPLPVSAASAGASIVDRMYDGVDVYHSGIVKLLYRNPIYGVDELIGFPIVGKSPDDPLGWVEITMDLGLPANPTLESETDGAVARGWALPEELDRALLEREARPKRGKAAHTRVGIFHGLPGWRDGEHVNWIARNGDYMRLMSRDATAGDPTDGAVEAPAGAGKDRRDGNGLATVSAADLLCSMSHGIAAGLEAGVGAVVLDGVAMIRSRGMLVKSAHRDMELETLRRGLKELAMQASRSRRLALAVDDELVAEGFLNELKSFERQRKATEARIAALEAERSSVDLSDGVEAEMGLLLRGIAALGELEATVDRKVAAAISEIFEDIRLTKSGEGTVEWSCYAVVAADGQAVRLGPFTGHVADLSVSARTARSDRREQGLPSRLAEEMTEVYMTQPITIRGVTQQYNLGHFYGLGLVRSCLKENGFGGLGVVSIPLDAPLPLRQELWRMASHANHPDAGERDGWQEVVRRTYFEVDADWPGSWERHHPAKQKFVDDVGARGGAMAWSPALSLVGGSKRRLFEFTGGVPGPDAVALRAGTERNAVLRGTVRLVSCPYCGEFATMVRCIPELAHGLAEGTMLLCTTCHRPAVAGAPVFPDWYFTRPVAPAAADRLESSQSEFGDSEPPDDAGDRMK